MAPGGIAPGGTVGQPWCNRGATSATSQCGLVLVEFLVEAGTRISWYKSHSRDACVVAFTPSPARAWVLLFLALQEASPSATFASSRYILVLVESLVEVGPVFGAGLCRFNRSSSAIFAAPWACG